QGLVAGARSDDRSLGVLDLHDARARARARRTADDVEGQGERVPAVASRVDGYGLPGSRSGDRPTPGDGPAVGVEARGAQVGGGGPGADGIGSVDQAGRKSGHGHRVAAREAIAAVADLSLDDEGPG